MYLSQQLVVISINIMAPKHEAMTRCNMYKKKPVLLIFPFEQLAHYLRCITLAQRLSPYFEIRFAASERYQSFIAASGFETFPCDAMDVDEVAACVKRFDFSWINRNNLERAFNSQVAVITKWQPAAVLGDAMPTLNMAAEKSGVPFISLLNGYMTRHYSEVRTMSWRHPLYAWFRFLPAPVLNALTKQGEAVTFRAIHKPFQELRRQYGLLKKFSYADELEGTLNLICDVPELFPQQPLPKNHQWIPPLIYQPAGQSHQVVTKLDASKQTLFVSMGSTGDWAQVLFLNDPFFQQYNIVTAGDAAHVVHGPEVIRTDFVNIEPLFKHIDLVLCHGGNGTIYQALLYGIPLLCKTAHFEQEWNVQALEKNGLGASLDAVDDTIEYQEIIAAWMHKKHTAPFIALQKAITDAAQWEPAIARILELVPSVREMPYYEQERNSA